jgi:hypothetical protein
VITFSTQFILFIILVLNTNFLKSAERDLTDTNFTLIERQMVPSLVEGIKEKRRIFAKSSCLSSRHMNLEPPKYEALVVTQLPSIYHFLGRSDYTEIMFEVISTRGKVILLV